ncbi:MAG: glutamate--tRNA ligase [Rhodobacteraceae bacterium]|nr:glutamate--tRNA ligase [Paracoccaceae bacterium]
MSGPVTRFAPSPTGMLHIGGARTALFNWLHARANSGTFRLRIEDTDRKRSTPEAQTQILEGLAWLGLDHDGAWISQHARAERHIEIARTLLKSGHAYRCYATPEEIAAFKAGSGQHAVFVSPWRDDRTAGPARERPCAVRLRIPDDRATVIHDAVFGTITWPHAAIEDLVILRADQSPTYNLAAAVDDHDMAVSYVIRGDDHLANTPKQILIYKALDWPLPHFAHLPLIHDEDGKKLSKRSGQAGLETYRDQGYLPEAMRNYLSRLGWSHGDADFYTTEQAIGWFTIDRIRKSPSRLDHKKLDHLAQRHMAAMAHDQLRRRLKDYMDSRDISLPETHRKRLLDNIAIFQARAKTLQDLVEGTTYLREGLLEIEAFDPRIRDQLTKTPAGLMASACSRLRESPWERDALKASLQAIADDHALAFGKVAAPLRAAITGKKASPGLIDLLIVLGRQDSLHRIMSAIELSEQGPRSGGHILDT